MLTVLLLAAAVTSSCPQGGGALTVMGSFKDLQHFAMPACFKLAGTPIACAAIGATRLRVVINLQQRDIIVESLNQDTPPSAQVRVWCNHIPGPSLMPRQGEFDFFRAAMQDPLPAQKLVLARGEKGIPEKDCPGA